jgi:hypothetical protein
MAEQESIHMRSSVRLCGALCLVGLFAAISAGADILTKRPETSRYAFLSDQSTVTKTGGFAGVHETRSIEGSFVLRVDPEAGMASFDSVDATITDERQFFDTHDLNELFNMTPLAGTIVDDATIEFRGKTADEVCDVSLRLVVAGDTAHLTGETIPPANSADMFVLELDAAVERKYGGGTGEADSPYLIYTAEQLNQIGLHEKDWGKHFKLMADINLAELGDTQFNIIGTNVEPSCIELGGKCIMSTDPTPPFTGTFDGNGHAVSGFVCTSAPAGSVGLFGVLADANAAIRNLRLIAPEVDVSAPNIGSLVGYLRQGTLRNCHAENVDVHGYWETVGGLVGDSGVFQSMYPMILNCSCTGRVSSDSFMVGGLVGRNWNGTFYECYAGCELRGASTVGGLVGDATSSKFLNCYSAGNVRGGDVVGGLVGIGRAVVIVNCYSANRIAGTKYLGGLIGRHSSSNAIASFWDAEISDRLDYAGAAGRTTAEMQDPNMYMGAGWDFVGKADGPSDIWAEPVGGGYPVLAWQLPEPPELLFPGGTGSPDDPYLIATAEQLNSIGHNPRLMEAHFRLVNDIDLSGVHFYPMGDEEYAFSGVFDGGDFTISNLACTGIEAERSYLVQLYNRRPENIGLFRIISGDKAEVRNLKLLDPVINATNTGCVGSLVGLLRRGRLCNCQVEGGRVSGYSGVGGLVGQSGGPYAYRGRVRAEILSCGTSATVSGLWGVGGLVGANAGGARVDGSRANGDVSGDGYVGGLVGMNAQAVIAGSRSGGTTLGKQSTGGLVGRNAYGTVQCSFSAAIVQGDTEVGGLAGWNYGTITNCYAITAVTGEEKVGGLAGRNGLIGAHSEDPGTVSNCYSACRVSGMQEVGGLVGYDELGMVTVSFWDVDRSGLPVRAGGAGKTTAEMQTASTFLDAGWDFVDEAANGTDDIWWILEGQDYPRLWWEAAEE